MTFEVQTGTGSATANAYISESEFSSYWADRGVEASDFDSEDIMASIIKATDYIDFRFHDLLIGDKKDSTFLTEFPRINAFDSHNFDVSDSIPNRLKFACCEYAYRDLKYGDLIPDPDTDGTGQNIKSKRTKVDVLETEVVYKDDFVSKPIKEFPKADLYMKPLLKSAGSSAFLLRG